MWLGAEDDDDSFFFFLRDVLALFFCNAHSTSDPLIEFDDSIFAWIPNRWCSVVTSFQCPRRRAAPTEMTTLEHQHHIFSFSSLSKSYLFIFRTTFLYLFIFLLFSPNFYCGQVLKTLTIREIYCQLHFFLLLFHIVSCFNITQFDFFFLGKK